MSERTIFSLVGQTGMILGKTHRFEPGPMYAGTLNLDPEVDVYAYVRYNNGFTPPELISQYMNGWSFKEDKVRHERWHGRDATWFDVLTNKISVDRSSVGNALYVVLNMGTSGGKSGTKNYADIEKWSTNMRSSNGNLATTSNSNLNQPSMNQMRSNNSPSNSILTMSNTPQLNSNQTASMTPQSMNEPFNAQKMFEMQLRQQELQQQAMMQQMQQQQQSFAYTNNQLGMNQFPQQVGVQMMPMHQNTTMHQMNQSSPQSGYMMPINHPMMANQQLLNQQQILNQMSNEQLLNQISNPQLIYQQQNPQSGQMLMGQGSPMRNGQQNPQMSQMQQNQNFMNNQQPRYQ